MSKIVNIFNLLHYFRIFRNLGVPIIYSKNRINLYEDLSTYLQFIF